MTGTPQILAVGAAGGGVAGVFRRVMTELRRDGLTVQELSLPERRAPAWSGIAGAVGARRLVRSAGIVHVEFGSNDTNVFWFALAASFLRRNCVVVGHDYPKLVNDPAAALVSTRTRIGRAVAFRVLSPLLDRAIIGLAVRRAGVIVVFGEDAAAGWRARGARHVTVIGLGADPAPEDLDPPPSRGEMVLYAGHMGPSKGIDVLLRAWDAIGTATNLPLVLAGPSYEPWLSETLAGHMDGRRPPRVLGRIPDEEELQRLIGRAAVVVLPYRYSSPASGILTRALSAGRPVVTTPVPAMQVITDGENGVLVPIDDDRALGAAIARLCASPSERDRLGREARRTAATHFTWEGHLAGLREAYRVASSDRTLGRARDRA